MNASKFQELTVVELSVINGGVEVDIPSLPKLKDVVKEAVKAVLDLLF